MRIFHLLGFYVKFLDVNIDELPVTSGYAGDRVNLTLSNYDIQNINVGYILCDPASPVPVTSRFEARIVIFNINVPITIGIISIYYLFCWAFCYKNFFFCRLSCCNPYTISGRARHSQKVDCTIK